MNTGLQALRGSLTFIETALRFSELLRVLIGLLPLPLRVFAIRLPEAASGAPRKTLGMLPHLLPALLQEPHA